MKKRNKKGKNGAGAETKGKAAEKTNRDSAKQEPKWKTVQRVVALLEKSIDPDSEVLHDQLLPDLTTGQMRQCDVVVNSGLPARSFLTIVEVQARGVKVDIGTFEGWVKKKESLGANCLICVSEEGFPDSVKEQVSKKYGPCVRLLTLRELESGEWSGWQLLYLIPSLTLAPGGMTLISTIPADQPVAPNALQLYREGESAPTKVFDLVRDHFDRLGPLDLRKGTHQFDVTINIGKRIYSEFKGVRAEVSKLVVPVIITVDEVKLPLVVSAYEQVDTDGVIAWAARAEGTLSNGQSVEFRMVFVPDGGGFRVTVQSPSAPDGGYLTIYPAPVEQQKK